MSSISAVGVVGLGTMGAGIAQVIAGHGHDVVACDISAAQVEAGVQRIAAGLGRHVARGRMSEPERAETIARVRAGTDLASLAPCDLVIEAVVEDLAVKRDLFAGLEEMCRPDAVLATNTSALSVAAIAAATTSAGRVVGLHFFNPAPVLPLVELVVTDATEPAVVEAVRSFAVRIGKQPIVCADRPGFVVNRILIPLLNDCVGLYAEGGISARDLDRAMTAGLNWPMGPLALIDLIGADVHLAACRALWEASGDERAAPPALIEEMVKAGRLGRKTGAGFHVYEQAREGVALSERDDPPDARAPGRT